MIHTKILISRKSDPPLQELQNLTWTKGELEHFIILEGGMVSGASSIMMHVKTQGGIDVIVETSVAMMDALYHAMLGAEERFKNNPE